MAAGLPGWAQLNEKLIEEYFNRQRAAETGSRVDFEYEPEELYALAKVFSDRFGKDAVIDLLRSGFEDEEEFHDLLHRALYGTKTSYDLQPLHHELAAAMRCYREEGRHANLYTLNFDDALERAIEQVMEEVPKTVTTQAHPGNLSVVHLHGFLPIERTEDGHARVEGDIVLSEKDFLKSRHDNADQKLQQLLADPDVDIVFLGMSLSDPRLRRLLFAREEKRKQNPDDVDDIWAFISKEQPSRDDTLPYRRAKKTATQHLAQYWKSWHVNAIETSNYEMLPAALRVIRLGQDVEGWLQEGSNFLENQGCYEDLYSDERQAKAQLVLMQHYDFMRQRFEINTDEHLTFSFYIPSDKEPSRLVPAFRFSDPRFEHRNDRGDWFEYEVYDGKEYRLSPLSHFVTRSRVDPSKRVICLQCMTEESATRRTLEVPSFESAQGVTGVAVVTGVIMDAYDQESFFHNFENNTSTPGNDENWEEERSTYSALMSIPVYDSSNWVPIGAACVTSTRRDAFWRSLTPADSRDLETSMRSTFRNLLAYTSCY